MTCGIYGIKNKINGKIYVGKSVNIEFRFSQHSSELKHNKHKNGHLQNSYNKHGKEFFEIIILEVATKQNLSILEQKWIDSFSKEKLYNIIVEDVQFMTASSNPFFGKQHTEATKNKMSLAKKGKYKGSENPNFGNKNTLESKTKMSISQGKLTKENVLEIKNLLLLGTQDKEIAKKFNISRTVITRIANGTRWANITGGPVVNQDRRLLRLKREPRSKETKEKIRTAITGIKRSEETKKKISLSKTKLRNI